MTNRRRSLLVAGAVLAAGLPVAGVSVAGPKACGSEVKTPKLVFGDRVYVDKNRAGGEPVTVVGHDGSISFSAHAGTTHIYKDPSSVASEGVLDFTNEYSNQTLNWRSTDGGKTWTYVGLGNTGRGPHTLASSGFSDPDFAIDAGGRIYNTEINLANVAVFSSGDDGQTYSRGNPEVTSGDRPWLTAAGKDEVYLYVNTLQQIFRSTDGGITWTLQSRSNQNGPDAKMYVDPRNPKTGLIGPHNPDGIAISADQGKTWEAYDGAELGPTVDFFGGMAVDAAGHAYRAGAGGYTGSGDTEANGEVTFNWFDRSKMAWNPEAVTIPTPKGDALWPWVVAGDDGRVAVAWLQSLEKDPESFYVYVAQTLNARGTKVRCSNGSTKVIPPRWAVANASKKPIHVGPICLNGTACNASTDFPDGDRRLGDFITVNYDKDGALMIGSADTTLGQSVEGGTTKPVSNPIFIKAVKGAKMLKKPMKTRPTRPLCGLSGLDPLC
jgi:hypothetical protein